MATSNVNQWKPLFWFLWVVLPHEGIYGCQGDENGTMSVRFTSDSFIKQHVVRKGFQVISCTAVNFCHVTWFKDGNPYPWDLGEFNVVSLEDRNQTLRFQAADEDAEGFYTCMVSNGRQSINRTIKLQVDNPFWNAIPVQLTTMDNICRNQTAELGSNVNFSCHYYAGEQVAETQVYWLRPNTSSMANKTEWLTLGQIKKSYTGTIYKEKIIYNRRRYDTRNRNFNGTASVGNNLQVVNVSDSAYGLYRVIANNDGHFTNLVLTLSPPVFASKEEDESHIGPYLLAVAGICLAAALLFLVWKMATLDLKLWYNGHYGNDEQNDGRLYDAYISYNWTDRDRQFVLDVIMPYLEKYRYKIFVPEIHTIPSNVLLDELSRAMESSRRCIMVISPSVAMATDVFQYEVHRVMDAMSSNLSLRIIPIFLGVSPCADKTPLDSSSGASSTPTSPSMSLSLSSLSSSSQQDISCNSSQTSHQGLPSPSLVMSSFSVSNPSIMSNSSSKKVKINFNFCPLLGQLVNVLKPLKTSRKEPCKPECYKRFLKRLRLRMPKPARNSGIGTDMVHEMVTVPHTRVLLDYEIQNEVCD